MAADGCDICSCCSYAGKSVVPAFSIRSWQSGILVEKPPKIDVFAERPTRSLAFRRIYDRGDLPVVIVHESRLYRLGWKVSKGSSSSLLF